MTRRRRYFYRDEDRHGNVRWYFKPPGSRKTRLKAAEGTRAFYEEQDRLIAMWEAGTLAVVLADRGPRPGTVEWLLRTYQASATFGALGELTQTQRRNFFVRFCRLHGDVMVRDLTQQDMQDVVDAFGDRKGAARNFLKSMRAPFAWARADGKATVGPIIGTHDPTAGVALPRLKGKGRLRWHLEHVEKFLGHWTKGSKPRRALAILLFTGVRISDAGRLGRGHVKTIRGREWIMFDMQKTGGGVRIPLVPQLKAGLGDSFGEMVWLQTEYGAPYSPKSLPQTFSGWASDSGLPDGYTAHGLRKNMGSLLAQLGMNEDVIMAILGHTTAEEARGYIVEVNKERLAERGMTAFSEAVAGLWR